MTRPILLALVRHGESVWISEGRFQGRGDPPLSDAGSRQAAAVAARLVVPSAAPSVPVPDTAPLAIWHSPLQRAAQTATAIHQARGTDAPLRSLETLSELAQGEWEGLTHTEVRQRYPDELAAWRTDPLHHHAPGGESLPEAMLRAGLARESILGLKPEAASAAEAEPAPAEPALAEPVLGYEGSYGQRREPPWAIVVAHDGILRLLMLSLLGIEMDRFWSFPMALAAISVLDLSGDVVRLRAHNLDEHIVALDRG